MTGHGEPDPMTGLHDQLGELGLNLAWWDQRETARDQAAARKAGSTAAAGPLTVRSGTRPTWPVRSGGRGGQRRVASRFVEPSARQRFAAYVQPSFAVSAQSRAVLNSAAGIRQQPLCLGGMTHVPCCRASRSSHLLRM